MMRILIVEDSQERIDAFRQILKGEIVVTGSANAAIDLLSRGGFDVLFLDYDLGERKDTGGKVARWLEVHPQPGLRIIIHSLNPVGAERMARILPKAERRPFVFPDIPQPQTDGTSYVRGPDAPQIITVMG